MTNHKQLLDGVMRLTHSEVRNYVVPGLSSYLVGSSAQNPTEGVIRLFSSERDQREFITPHSHRFDFTCLVLAGEVMNVLYERGVSTGNDHRYIASTVRRDRRGQQFTYEIEPGIEPSFYIELPTKYVAGDVYAMLHTQIHTISFSRGAKVLFFEGPSVTAESVILEPWSNGKRVPTFRVADWMFERK